MKTWQTLRPVIRLFWNGNRKLLVYGVILSFSTALAGIALLGLSGWFITATSIAGASMATALAFDVFMPSAGIRLLALGRTASRYGERLVTHDATLRVLSRLRERLFHGWAQAEAFRALMAHPSRILFRLTVDIDALDTVYLRVIVPVLTAFGAALVVCVALSFVSTGLALAVGAALLVLGFGIPFIIARLVTPMARRRAHGLEILRSRAIDLAKGQTDLLMANRLGAQVEALARADHYLAATDRALNRAENNVGLGFGILSAALLAGSLVAVAFLVEAGTIDAPVAALAVLLVLASIEPFAPLARGAVEFGRTLLASQRLGPKLDADTSTRKHMQPLAGAPVVELSNVQLRYAHAGGDVLNDLSLTLQAGERVALIGPSGSGKSSILSLIAGEISASSGKISACRTALLTQRTELFQDSLRGNLAIADPDADEKQLLAALDGAGLSSFFAGLPDGLDTMLGEGGAGLSAGQARRLALARLLLSDAPVWLLDEPTEGLDAETASDVLARLHASMADRTAVIASHYRREAELADRVISLRNGSVIMTAKRNEPEFQKCLESLKSD